jgi:hypothetical protein
MSKTMGNIYPIFLNEKYPKNIWTIYPKTMGNKIQNLRFGARCRRQGFNPMGDPSEEYTLKADGFRDEKCWRTLKWKKLKQPVFHPIVYGETWNHSAFSG